MIYDGYRGCPKDGSYYTYRRVLWPSLAEKEDLTIITGGSLELSALSDLMASGTLSFTGGCPDYHDLIRVYYNFVDEVGNQLSQPLGTFFTAKPNPTYDMKLVSGSVNLYSVLHVPASKKYGRDYTVKAGTNAVAKAVELLEGLNVKTNKPRSSYKLKSDKVFEPDDSYLYIANQLLSAAGFAACTPDAYGRINIVPYIEPQGRSPSWTFRDDERSIMEPQVIESSTFSETPNCVRLFYESDDMCVWAYAANDDKAWPGSRTDLGYEVTLHESISELDGDTAAKKLANLKSQAIAKLRDNTQRIEYVELKHPWVPLWPNDAASVVYTGAGKTWSGTVVSEQLELADHLVVTSRIRKIARPTYKPVVGGGTW